MPAPAPPARRSLVARLGGRAMVLAALLAALVAALTNVGNLTNDPYTRYLVAESVLREGDLDLERELTIHADRPRRLLTVEHEARTYSVFFPGQSLAMLPAALVAEIGHRTVGGEDGFWRDVGCFLAAVGIMPFFGGLAVLGHGALLRTLGVRPAVAATSALVLAFGTVAWPWTSQASEEPILGACAAWAWVLVHRARRASAGEARDLDRIGLAGVLLAFGLLHRATFGPVALGGLLLALPRLWAMRGWIARTPWRLLAWGVAVLGVLAILPLYNLARFDDLLDTGYARFYDELGGLWATPLWQGLAGHLVSPGKSMLLYSPWLLLLVPAACSRDVRTRLGLLGPVLLLVTLLHLVIYSKTTFWAGGFGWAVRYHVSLMPLLLVPVGAWLEARAATRPGRAILGGAVAPLAALTILVQVLGVSLNTGLETTQHREDYAADDERVPIEAAWAPARSPLLLRARNVADKLRGAPLLPDELGPEFDIQAAWNVFPVRASVALPGSRVPTLLWAGWSVLLLATAGTAARLVRAWPRESPETDA